jgi:hypothetical protein
VWRPYDPSWLVELAEKQEPGQPWLSAALERCTRASGTDGCYVHFVDASDANEPGADWQFRENIVLEHPVHGELVLDVLQDGRVGDFEFLDRVLGAR